MVYDKKALVYSDLDGTLLADNHYFSKFTKEVIKEMYDKGIMLVIATARQTKDVFEQARRLGIDQYGGIIAGNNGSQIYDLKNHKWILNQYVPRDIIESVFKKHFNKFETKIHFYSNGETYVFNEGKNSLYWAQIQGSDYIVAHDVEEIKEPITHFTFVLNRNTTDEQSKKFIQEFKTEFGDRVDMNIYTNRVIEICPLKVNKGYVVKKVNEYLNVDPKITKTYGFGDSYNDFSMFTAVDVAVAMENAVPELKQIAHDTTQFNNQENGVAHYIQDNILKED
ncbi:HAD superfamily hydrolase [Williamsoniiplasma luminosum]|uniref:HAD superfamily hydrolase n=1 Tax=Williamsoniiplasma luminosum TaxID=214888 RepID=A0A2K8NVU5_9MOLU|nr:Cof-type HAD-IIB family hydrolase [Williamsoniiplasma luminosum]ATZ16753.1 HAD superfamily hydrolase [Williamsoniiplasma luminosum]